MLFLLTNITQSAEAGQAYNQDPEPKWYLQLGAGYAVWKQNQQIGFNESGKFGTINLEIGKKYKPLSVGAYMSNSLKSTLFNYDMNQKIYGLYAKYSINRFIPGLPHGIDPYVFAGSTAVQTRLTKNDISQEKPVVESVQEKLNASYSFGGGIQVGSEFLIFGFHYQFTPVSQLFDINENPQLKFNTSIHQAEVRLAIRLVTPDRNKSGCYSFNRKKAYIKF
jgi:opacity protein-like surface antigen